MGLGVALPIGCVLGKRAARRSKAIKAISPPHFVPTERDDSVWRDFEWLPEKLVSMWVMGVKAKHEKHGWGSMPGILWNQDTMVFFGCYDGLLAMLKVATKSWRPNKRHEYQTYLASIVLSIECLGCDFAGWGAHYPEAKRKASEILDTYFINNRMRLLDVYMPLRGQLDQDKIRETLGPHEG